MTRQIFSILSWIFRLKVRLGCFFHYGHKGATVSQFIFQRILFEDEIRLYMLVIVVNLLLCWVEISFWSTVSLLRLFWGTEFYSIISRDENMIAIKGNIRMGVHVWNRISIVWRQVSNRSAQTYLGSKDLQSHLFLCPCTCIYIHQVLWKMYWIQWIHWRCKNQ